MIVERNDVDISKLFSWGKKFEIQTGNEKTLTVVYMRLLGDADVNRARVYALRKSAELRKKLRDTSSDERLVYVKEIDELTEDELKQYVAMFSMREISGRAVKEVNVPLPKQPKSDAKLERMEKYQKEIDEYPEKVQKALNDFVKKETEKLLKTLEPESKESLYNTYLTRLVEEFCEQEALRAYNDMEIYLGCYKDENYKERFFSSLDEYENLLTEDKISFRAAYQTLHLPMEELKKLREATQ